ncbi:MAG: hypothetical protein AABY83_14690 [Pseudomonadota bacterium]
MRYLIGLLYAVTMVAHSADAPQDIQGLTVFGNREAPKSMVVMPWRDAGSTDLTRFKLENVLSEELVPIDPDQFRRKVELHSVLRSSKVTVNEH